MNNRQIRRVLVLAAAVMLTVAAQAQEVALKTNLLYAATTTPNLGIEIGLGKKMTGQVFYGINPWTFNGSNDVDRKVKHWLVMPELRWWSCTKMNGWFFGVHAMGGQFNAGNVDLPLPGTFFKGDNLKTMVKDTRVEGKYLGGGLTVGYQWILSRHWNLEAELGAGYDHVWYDQYPCSECGTKISKGETNYVGLTKAGLSFLYIF